MAFSMTSNRGLSGFPSGYEQAWNAYNPTAQQGTGRLTGHAARNANAAENMAYAQGGGAGGITGMLQQLLGVGGAAGGGQQVSIPYRGGRPRSGRGAPGTALQFPQQGGGGGLPGGGGQMPAGGAVPPATTNPQTPVAQNPLAGLAATSPGITSGQLSNEAIQQAMAALVGGGTGGFSGGMFGDLMNQNNAANATELQRAAAQQQADMQQAFEVARANAGIQQNTLASDINRQDVMHGVNMRSDLLGLFSGLMGGLI